MIKRVYKKLSGARQKMLIGKIKELARLKKNIRRVQQMVESGHMEEASNAILTLLD